MFVNLFCNKLSDEEINLARQHGAEIDPEFIRDGKMLVLLPENTLPWMRKEECFNFLEQPRRMGGGTWQETVTTIIYRSWKEDTCVHWTHTITRNTDPTSSGSTLHEFSGEVHTLSIEVQ